MAEAQHVSHGQAGDSELKNTSSSLSPQRLNKSIATVASAASGHCSTYHFFAALFAAIAVPVIVDIGALQGSNCKPGSGSACGSDPLLNTFPYSLGTRPKLLWVLRRLPWLSLHLALFYGVTASAIWQLLNLTVAAAAWRQPRWYQTGGATFLSACLRSAAVNEVACCMVFGSKQDIHRIVVGSFYKTSGNSITLIIWLTVMCQLLPLPVPALLARLQRRQAYRGFRLAVQSCNGSTAACAKHVNPEKSCAYCHTSVSPASGGTCQTATAPFCSVDPDFCTRVSDATATIWADSLSYMPSPPCGLIGASPAAGPTSTKPALYMSKVKTKLLSIKVFDHHAYDQRLKISAAVEKQINQHYISKHSGALVDVCTATWEGCLQLLVAIAENGLKGTGISSNSFSAEELAQFMDPVLAKLNLNACSIHMPSSDLYLSAGYDPNDTPSKSAKFTEKCQPNLVSILPFCVPAAITEPAFVTIAVSPAAATAAATAFSGAGAVDHGPVEVIVRACCDGEACTTQKLQLGCFPGPVRLDLPRDISTGPFSVHIMSCQPGYEGALLGSISTVALPSPACQELQQLLHDEMDDVSVRAGLCELLQDMASIFAIVFNGTGSFPVSGTEALSTYIGVTQDMLAYFQDNRMLSCHSTFSRIHEELLRSSKQQQQQPHQVGSSTPASGSTSVQAKCMSPDSVTCQAPAAIVEMPTDVVSRSGLATSPTFTTACPGTSAGRNTSDCPANYFLGSSPRAALPYTQCVLPARCDVAHVLFGFSDRSLEEEYAEFRGGTSTQAADTLCLCWYVMLLVMTHIRRGKMFLRWSPWFPASLLPCIASFAALVSPWRRRLGRRRSTVIGIARALGSWIHALGNYQGWVVGQPETLKQMTDSCFDLLFCLQFPLVTQTSLSFWVLASATGEFVAEAVSFAPVIGIHASTARMLATHALGVLAVVKIDMWARKAFLRRRNDQAKKIQ